MGMWRGVWDVHESCWSSCEEKYLLWNVGTRRRTRITLKCWMVREQGRKGKAVNKTRGPCVRCKDERKCTAGGRGRGRSAWRKEEVTAGVSVEERQTVQLGPIQDARHVPHHNTLKQRVARPRVPAAPPPAACSRATRTLGPRDAPTIVCTRRLACTIVSRCFQCPFFRFQCSGKATSSTLNCFAVDQYPPMS